MWGRRRGEGCGDASVERGQRFSLQNMFRDKDEREVGAGAGAGPGPGLTGSGNSKSPLSTG